MEQTRVTSLSSFSMRESERDCGGTVVRTYDFLDGDIKACSVGSFEWWDGTNIEGLEVSDGYRGRGLSYLLLDFAVNELGATKLAVAKDNSIAMHAYEKFGFVPVDEDESFEYMEFRGMTTPRPSPSM